MSAPEPPTADALRAALGPYARARRFPGGLRVLDVPAPYLMDGATRDQVSAALQPLLQRFWGAPYGRRVQPFTGMLAIVDRMLLVVGANRSDLRCWISYTMLAVHRRPVMWVHAIVIRPGLESARVVPMILGAWVLREWARHRCRALYAVTLTRNKQFLRYSRTACGEGNFFPRADGSQPPEVRQVVEVVGNRIVYGLRRSGAAAHASLDADALVVRNGFEGAPPSRGSEQLGPHDAHLMVGRVSARALARQVPRIPDMLRARRRAEARLGGLDAAQR